MEGNSQTTNKSLFYRHIAQTSPAPMALDVAYAKGSYLYDSNNKAYLDLISGISVSNLGHGQPKIVKAIQEQAERFLHTMVYGEHIQAPQTLLAKALIDQLGAPFESVYFVNSGSEAIEGAIKLAKRHTNRFEILSFRNAYHGSTHAALSAMGGNLFSDGYLPLVPGFEKADFNSFEDLQKITNQHAAVLIEPIQGEAGYIKPTHGFLDAVRKRCNETGTLLIFDEIQSGFGRSGTLFAFQSENVIPDILVMAKGMGGGMPLGAFVASQSVMANLMSLPVLGHITTFGGHPVSCAASRAALELILSENLLNHVGELETRFRSHFLNHGINLSGKGLMLSIDLESFENVTKVINEVFEKGILIDWFLFNDRSLRIAPPLNLSFEDCDFASSTLIEAIQKL